MKTLRSLLCAIALLGSTAASFGQSMPVIAGAEAQTAGAKLTFVNAPAVSLESGAVHKMVYTIVTNLTLTNGFYLSTNLPFQSLSTSASPASAAVGSFIVCEVVSVAGPEGGVLSFWEQGSRSPTYMFPANTTPTPGANVFDVSQIDLGAGLPDGDPYGAIPGRRFTVNKGGEYAVAFKLHDTSKNHPTLEAPIHAPSELMSVKFATSVETWINRMGITNNIATLVVHQGGLTNLFVDAKEDLAAASWSEVAGPFSSAPVGTNLTLVSVTNANTLPAQFFRLRAVAP